MRAVESPYRPDPVNGPKRDLHRIRPVDADAGWVRRHPALQLSLHLDGVPLVIEDARRTGEGNEVVAAAELPRHLRVAVVVKPRDFHVLVEHCGPPVSALEVALPVDLGAQLSWA